MCLAIPGKIVDFDSKKEFATIDYGGGIKRKVNMTLVQARLGQYVLVHAGFAIQVLQQKEAKETLKLFDQILSASKGI